MASGQRIAVVGATGAVGQTTLKILEQRTFPIRELRAYASERSAGKTVTFAVESITVRRLDADSFKGIDIALFSAGSAQSREFAPIAVKAGAIVVDKSSAFRMDPDVPLVVPEINPAAARRHKGIVACPNCTTIVTVMPLKPIHDLGRLRRVVATSFQAVSGAGVNGVAELREQTIAWSRGEEIKLVNEIRKILEQPQLLISPTTVRVPVFTAHSISVNAETETKIAAADAREAFARFPGLRLFDDPAHNRYPMPIIAEGQDDCFVGRIREDLSCPNALNFWVVGDQLRKGAALNGVQIAELLISGR